ncbi:sulfatase-like hydrolase/transferase, partial [Candidatus Hydrogenedentota bacterium]
MNRRDFIFGIGSGFVAATAGKSKVFAVDAPAKKLPNIVIFLSDDHSRRIAGCYGDKVVKTPNMDRLAGEGMRFNCAFTPTAMCAPSRMSLSSGLHTHRHGLHVNSAKARPGIKRMKEYMTEFGYRVEIGGKAQIGPE